MESHALLDAVLPHVAFEGWTQAALDGAAADVGLTTQEVRALAPRGAVGLASAYHRRGDAAMRLRLAQEDMADLRFREKVALALRLRLESEDREIVRRGTVLFALPQHAAEGAQLIWGTADAIWSALGDSSDDVNWYSKRLILSGVFSSTVLYWLGDTSDGSAATWAFVDRRIEDVMRFEKVKAQLRQTPILGRMLDSPLNPLNRIHAPKPKGDGWPGRQSA